MVWIFFIIALIAGACLLPEQTMQRTGIIIPDQARLKRVWQILLFFALIFAMLALRLVPFAILLAIVGLGVIINSIWQDRAIDSDLRDEPQPGQAEYTPPPSIKGQMSVEEAYSVLGLKPDVSASDIDAVYRQLIAQIHPDKGGTDYLAAKINQARDVLKKHLSEN